jgi:hypothetical protein
MPEITQPGFPPGDDVTRHQHGLWRHISRHAPSATSWRDIWRARDIWRHRTAAPLRRHTVIVWLDHAFSTVAQTDDLHWFFGDFIVDVLPMFRNYLLCAQCCVRCPESFSVRKKWPRSNVWNQVKFYRVLGCVVVTSGTRTRLMH